MPDRIHTTVHPPQPSRHHAVPRAAVPQPQRAELGERHDSELPLSQLGKPHVEGWAVFRTHRVR